MAGKIKGITIEFRGDTTSLDKALRKVSQETKQIDKELNQVNKALKFNPSNVELWRQKQQLLTEKVSETKEKLKLLKDEQARLDASGVDKTSAEYRELQREIIVAESQLKTFEGQLRQVGNVNLKALGEGFKQAGTKATEYGKTLTKNVTAPILAVGAASIKAFNEVRDGLNIVAQKTGATGEELKQLQDIARDLAKTLPTTFEDSGTAVGEVATRFDITGGALESLSAQYIKFAKVNSVDLTNSIDETQKALAAYGKTAADAPGLLDTLTRASQMTGASVDTLTSGLIQNATAFQELGLNIDQSVMLMAQMEKSGANSETVMQGLRKALKNAAKDGIPLNEALADLQNTILNGTDGMDGLTAAYDLFGKSGDQIYGAVKNGTLDFTALAAAVDDTGGTLDAVFTETLTPAEEFQMTMNSLKDAGYEVGNSIMKVASPAIKKFGDWLKKVSDKWDKLNPKTKDAIVKFALIAATIGPLLIVFGKLATAIGSIISLAGVLIPIIAGISAPVLIAIAAITALIAIGVALYKNWDTIKSKAKALGDYIKNIWNAIKTATSDAWNSITNAITSPFTSAYDTIKSLIKKIKGWFPINIGSLFSKIKTPHFSIDWGKVTAFGKTISYPKGFDVDWYAKGGIFNSPTIAGIGDATGGEAVLPLDKFWAKMDRIAEATEANSGEVIINVYAPQGMDVNQLAAVIEAKLVAKQKMRGAAWST